MSSIITEDNELRANTYRLLAGLFLKEPDEDVLATMKEDLEMTFDDSPEDIALDFMHIFSGPGEHLSPYESLYNYPIGSKPALWGKAAEDAQSFYQAAGLVLDEEANMLPDHISAELLFMSYLAEKKDPELQKRFLDEHVMKWVPQFCDKVTDFAYTTFYKELAWLTKDFIEAEYKELRTGITREKNT